MYVRLKFIRIKSFSRLSRCNFFAQTGCRRAASQKAVRDIVLIGVNVDVKGAKFCCELEA